MMIPNKKSTMKRKFSNSFTIRCPVKTDLLCTKNRDEPLQDKQNVWKLVQNSQDMRSKSWVSTFELLPFSVFSVNSFIFLRFFSSILLRASRQVLWGLWFLSRRHHNWFYELLVRPRTRSQTRLCDPTIFNCSTWRQKYLNSNSEKFWSLASLFLWFSWKL